jgi:subtilisin family serine protease
MKIGTLVAAAAIAATLSLVSPAVSSAAATPAGARPPDNRALTQKVERAGTVPVVVQVRQRSDQKAVADLIRGNNGKVSITFDKFALLAGTVNSRALQALQRSPLVVAIQEDAPEPPTLASTIPVINADDVQNLGWTGSGWATAILDTGIDDDHPFFGSRIVSEACYSNGGGGGGGTSLCPDGTNAQTGSGAANAETTQCLNGTVNLCAHGSHVAGIAAGNAAGVSGAPGNGVAPGANIVAIQVFTRFTDSGSNTPCATAGQSSPCVLTLPSDQILGLQRVLTLSSTVNIAAANMSLGGGNNSSACDTDTRKAAIDNLLSSGIATVISSGNNGFLNAVGAPGCISTAVTVGATDDSDNVASFSNRGPLLDLFAPGVAVVSSVPDDTFTSMQGTSMAAPHVTGALAVLRQAYPSATPATLLGYLTSTGVSITYSTGGTSTATTPRIDLLGALQAGNQPPSLTATNPAVSVAEGATASNTGTFSDPEGDPVTLTASVGTVTAAGGGGWSWSFGTNDGPAQSQLVTITGTDNKGERGTATFALTVNNVPPTVTTDPAQTTSINEGDVLQVLAHFSDPGKDAPYTAVIDWGTPYGETSPGSLVVTDVSPPQRGDVTGNHRYGDNGTFTIRVSVTDKDGGAGSTTFAVTVKNTPPTAAIDKSSSTPINGTPTFIAHAGQPLSFSGRSTDPGSDDLLLTWNWGDGTPSTPTRYLNDPVGFPGGDPLPSPTVNPRDVTDTRSHTFGNACFYTLGFSAVDDDGGASPTDTAAVIVAGNATTPRNSGYWQTQYRPRPTAFSEAQRQCYLRIAGFMSAVFNEARDASTVAKAFDILFVGTNLGTPSQQLDRQLLAAWLNFANGAFQYGGLVDTNGDGVADTPFSTVMTNAEAVRLNPASTPAQLLAQKDLLERINGV